MGYKVTEDIPRQYCTPDLLGRVRCLGYKSDGYIRSLEKIIKDRGFNLPGNEDIGGKIYYGFRHNNTVKLYLNYCDAVANEIIFLHEKELIK